jgi:hypothetical protein
MTRLLSSFVTAVFSLLVIGIPHTNAAELDTILAPGSPPLTRETSDASAGVTVFVLKLVATGDVEADDLDLDESLLDEWANALAAAYVHMSADEQAQFAAMPALRDTLYVVWPLATPSERAQVREAFRPLGEALLSQMDVADEPVVEAPAPATVAPKQQVTESPTAAYYRASAGLQASHNNYVHMSNVLLQNHVGNMNAILNMGNNNYRYEYKSRP